MALEKALEMSRCAEADVAGPQPGLEEQQGKESAHGGAVGRHRSADEGRACADTDFPPSTRGLNDTDRTARR
ncbi:hypothetical protein QEG98_11380 [Myxococcus sp. MxC21-1]|uniref:hypothetical protein n=1 Tax=Myxococcus sp. MxC21-1 TaxID=3041439 RepID=UPI00292EA0F5|nr:hypothetical protein [Myxococcus sp. MxC21-1]WNZ64216.1 hypothetical protein QEG98_11380 [Myxococcus sp. MxC21-1]